MSDEQPRTEGAPDPQSTEGPESAQAAAAESDRIARLRARSAAPPTSEPVSAPSEPSEPSDAAARPAAAEPVAPPAAPTPAAPAPAAPAAAPPAAVTPPPPAAVTPPPPATLDTAPYLSPAPDRANPRRSPAAPWLAAGVAAAVLAATATALAGLVTSRVSSANAVESTRSEVVGAATSGVATVLSYDYRHLDTDFAAAERLLTPRFRKQYDDTTGKGVRPLAAKYKAISSADVSAAGVVDAQRDRAVVLVFVNQTVTNSQLTAPRLDRSRIDVTLVRSNGRWLIDKLTTL